MYKVMGYMHDCNLFADSWRALYQPTMEEVRSGRQPFVKLDILRRRMLDKIRPRFGLEKLDDKVAGGLYLACPRLCAGPGVSPRLVRPHQRFLRPPWSHREIHP